jgi:hypothetical protein
VCVLNVLTSSGCYVGAEAGCNRHLLDINIFPLSKKKMHLRRHRPPGRPCLHLPRLFTFPSPPSRLARKLGLLPRQAVLHRPPLRHRLRHRRRPLQPRLGAFPHRLRGEPQARDNRPNRRDRLRRRSPSTRHGMTTRTSQKTEEGRGEIRRRRGDAGGEGERERGVSCSTCCPTCAVSSATPPRLGRRARALPVPR